MFLLFLGIPLGKTFDEPVFNCEVGGVERLSEGSESDTVIACHIVIFVGGGVEGGVGVSLDFDFDLDDLLPATGSTCLLWPDVDGCGEGLSTVMT